MRNCFFQYFFSIRVKATKVGSSFLLTFKSFAIRPNFQPLYHDPDIYSLINLNEEN